MPAFLQIRIRLDCICILLSLYFCRIWTGVWRPAGLAGKTL